MSTTTYFLWRNKKKIIYFWLKTVPYLELSCKLRQHICYDVAYVIFFLERPFSLLS